MQRRFREGGKISLRRKISGRSFFCQIGAINRWREKRPLGGGEGEKEGLSPSLSPLSFQGDPRGDAKEDRKEEGVSKCTFGKACPENKERPGFATA